MWWMPAAMAVGSMIGEKERSDNLEAHNKGQAETTRYSPWTGMKGQIKQDTGPGLFGAGVSGAASGLAISQQFGGNAGGQGGMATTKSSPWSSNDLTPGGSTLDFDKYRMNRFSRTA